MLIDTHNQQPCPPQPRELRRQPAELDISFEPPTPQEDSFYQPLEFVIKTKTTEAIGKIAGTDVEIHCTIEGPADEKLRIDDVPLLIAHGYFGAEPAYDDYRHELAQRGKVAVTWEAARSKGLWHDLNLLGIKHPQLLASRAALGVTRAVQDKIGAEVFDGSGHSNGGQTVAELALHKPELFRSLTFLGSVGLDPHTFKEMLGRVGDFGKKDLLRPSIAKLALRPNLVIAEAKYALANLPLTAAEGISAATCDMHPRVIRNKENGIPVAAIQYQEDDFFPLNAVRAHSEHLFDVFHVYRNPKIRHTGPQEDPSGSAYAQLEVIRELIAKESSRATLQEAA